MSPRFLLQNNPIPQIGVPMIPGMPNVLNMSQDVPDAYSKRAHAYVADFGGCGHWRVIWPNYLLNIYQKGVVSTDIVMYTDPAFYRGMRSVRLQRQATPNQVSFVKHLKNISQQNGMKLLYEVDDVIFREDIPIYNGCRHAFESNEIRNSSVEAMLLCDKMTVVSEYMADYYRSKINHPNISYIPNYMPKFWFDRYYSEEKIETNYNKNCRKPRVGVFASGTHVDARNQNNQIDDFTHVNDVIIKTCKDIQWVVVGSKPHKLSPYIDRGLIEYHPWVSLNDFPAMMDKLGVNITFAPLIDNEFNKAKSDIKIVEAGALGIPCICQNLEPYKNAIVKFDKGDDLIDKIVNIFKNPDTYFDICRKSRKVAEGRWLEDHLEEYVDLYGLK